MFNELPADAAVGPATTQCVAVVWLFVYRFCGLPAGRKHAQLLAQCLIRNYSGGMCRSVNDSTLYPPTQLWTQHLVPGWDLDELGYE